MTTSPKTQLEVAAHWLREAAISVTESGLKRSLNRVADECEAVARREPANANS